MKITAIDGEKHDVLYAMLLNGELIHVIWKDDPYFIGIAENGEYWVVSPENLK